MDLSAERWTHAAQTEREALARGLMSALPLGFGFRGITRFQLGAQQHEIALYDFDGAYFAFIPAATASIGFDEKRPWIPTAAEIESWRSTSEEYEIARSIQQYVEDVTLRPRQIELPPLLIEVAAKELGWEPIAVHDPEVQSILREHGARRQVEVSKAGQSIRVRRGPTDDLTAERSLMRTHAEMAAEIAGTGFRFPTSSEWEYACGGGAQTLFRWGDHAPCDRYPTDISPAEAAWRKQWVLSAGKLERPFEGFTSDWDYHRSANAFGLLIGSDPYKSELVADIGLTRGGDGGCTVCGGSGFFVGWLTLATAYFEDHSCKHDLSEPICPGFTVGRRVLELR